MDLREYSMMMGEGLYSELFSLAPRINCEFRLDGGMETGAIQLWLDDGSDVGVTVQHSEANMFGMIVLAFDPEPEIGGVVVDAAEEVVEGSELTAYEQTAEIILTTYWDDCDDSGDIFSADTHPGIANAVEIIKKVIG